jgi:hypothetical protein
LQFWQPCIYGKKTDAESDDVPTIKRLGGFKVVSVFAQEDTDGERLPTLTYAAATGGEDLLPQPEAAAQKLSIQLDYEEIPDAGVQGIPKEDELSYGSRSKHRPKQRSFFMN